MRQGTCPWPNPWPNELRCTAFYGRSKAAALANQPNRVA